jgi:hypothetical protein
VSQQRLSRRAYAKHLGVSEGAVRHAIKEGRISVEEDGRIDPEKADAEWVANTSAKRSKVVRRKTGVAREEAGSKKESESLAEAQRQKEWALAKLRQLEVQKKAGELVDRGAVRHAWFAVMRALRDQLLSIPDRLHGSDREAHRRLSDELRSVCDRLAKQVPGLGVETGSDE